VATARPTAPRAAPRPAPIPAKPITPLPARRFPAPGGSTLARRPLAPGAITVKRFHPRTIGEQMRRTVQLVGAAVRDGATYLPLRQHVGKVAAEGAAPKDFMGQLRAVFADFVKRSKYVRDPRNAEHVVATGRAIWETTYGGGVRTGFHDCDDAAAAIGAALHGIGFPIRLVTSVPLRHAHDPRLRRLPGHIYVEAHVKPLGWIAVDPVVWPKHGVGYHAPALRRYRFDLFGRRLHGASFKGADEMSGTEDGTMYGRTDDITGWADYGLAEHGYALGYAEGETYGATPLDWSTYGLEGFGATADRIYDTSASGMLAEIETDARGLGRTPMVEMRPEDVAYVQAYGRPYDGMLGLGDDGSVYQWRPAAGFALGGFFKKIFGGIGKMVKKVAGSAFKLAQKGLKFAKKLIAKLPGGKYLVRFMDKIHKVAMKLVRPLMKIIGPLAAKLAPIAAMIPGYGPLISVALKAGGTIATLMSKHGIRQTKKGAVIPTSAKGMAAFKAELKQQAEVKRKAIAAARASGKLDPKHIPAGTPEHVAVLRAIGIKPPPGSPAAVAEAIEFAFGNPGRRRRRKRRKAAGAAPEPPEAPESQIPTEPTAPVEFAWY
jgi:hypothetical protein